MHEHRRIERMISVLAAEVESIQSSGAANVDLLRQAVDFVRWYADRCHHGKEEDILFARFAEKNPEPELASTMERLIRDHAEARRCTAQLAEATERYAANQAGALAAIQSAIQALLDIYPPHIETEDRHFFRPCLAYFSEEEREQMVADFETFEMQLLHEKYEGMLEQLEQERRPLAAAT